MPQTDIRRPVVRLDNSNQLSLFAGQEQANNAEPDLAKRNGGPRFQDPDPRAIFLNGVRLDEHLCHTGKTAVLKVRHLLSEQSWSEFESSYEPGGRPPYALRAMVGLILYGIMRGVTSLRDLE